MFVWVQFNSRYCLNQKSRLFTSLVPKILQTRLAHLGAYREAAHCKPLHEEFVNTNKVSRCPTQNLHMGISLTHSGFQRKV